MGAVPGNDLQLTADEMRQAGYRTVDMLVRHLTDEAAPPIRRAGVDEMRELLGLAAPEEGMPYDEVLAALERDVLPYRSRGDHPGFFAFIPYCGTWPGALGDFVASGANVYASSWMEAAGPTQVELEVLGWFKDWMGYPGSAAGILVSGGSAANMTALACAREALVGPMRDDLVVYVPDQAHSSLARAARVLGFRPDQVRVLPVGEGFRLDPATLQRAIEADVAAGRRPLFASVSGGSTNTGSVDPLEEIAAVCKAAGVWLHVDGAYGAFARLTERGRAALAGIELADSITLDPHKWLYQSYECGCVLVRDGDLLRRAFEIAPDYLADAVPGEREVNFSDLGLQLSRTTHAFKVWMSIRTLGVRSFRAAIDRAMDQAQLAQRLIEESDTLELTSPARFGIVCFRRRFDEATDENVSDRMHEELVAALERSGIAFISSTRLRGRFSLRMCIMNHTTRDEDIERTITFLATAAVPAGASPPAAALEPHVALDRGWLGAHTGGSSDLEPLALLQGLDDADLQRVLAACAQRTFEQGDRFITEGEGSRELYILLEGKVMVSRGRTEIGMMRPGDTIGEIAALEWGAGYGYARTASATATSRVRALVMPAGDATRLAREIPVLGERLRAIAQQRLHAAL